VPIVGGKMRRYTEKEKQKLLEGLLEAHSGYRDRFIESSLRDGSAVRKENGEILFSIGDNRYVSIEGLNELEVSKPFLTNMEYEEGCIRQCGVNVNIAKVSLDAALNSLDIKPFDSIHKRMIYERILRCKEELELFLNYLSRDGFE
jgi:hypothetical protein